VTPVRKASPMRSRLVVVVALVVLWILCAGCNPSVRGMPGDDLRCAPMHPQLSSMSSDDLSGAPGKRSSELTTRTEAPMTLISRGVSAYASTGNALRASDSSYATWWQAQSPCQQWIVYNLDDAGSLGKVLVVWYDDQTPPYDYTLVPGYRPIGLPRDYTLEVNAQGNLDRPPATGWTQVVAVAGNTYHSRQHLIDMTSQHWLRMSIGTALGGPGAMLHLDVYALHSDPPLSGDFLFLGDSITQGPALHLPFNGVVSIPQLIARKVAGSLRVEEDGGIQDMTPANSVTHLGTWLNLFPGFPGLGRRRTP